VPSANWKAGFSLVEIMVAVVIIGILATVVLLNVLPSLDRARTEKARTDVAALEQAVETYKLENLAYPTGEQGLTALARAPAGLAHPELYRPGGYIKRLPDDPWGRPYLYAVPGRSGGFDVYTLGADGKPGGEGSNADVGNW